MTQKVESPIFGSKIAPKKAQFDQKWGSPYLCRSQVPAAADLFAKAIGRRGPPSRTGPPPSNFEKTVRRREKLKNKVKFQKNKILRHETLKTESQTLGNKILRRVFQALATGGAKTESRICKAASENASNLVPTYFLSLFDLARPAHSARPP